MDSLTARTENGLGTDPPTAEFCCQPAPPVLEFDPAGALGSWGGPGQGFDWPVSPGGIAVDAKGNVWITAAGTDAPAGGRSAAVAAARRAPAAPPPPRRPADAHVLKFSRDGKFLLQIGKPGAPRAATARRRSPSSQRRRR